MRQAVRFKSDGDDDPSTAGIGSETKSIYRHMLSAFAVLHDETSLYLCRSIKGDIDNFYPTFQSETGTYFDIGVSYRHMTRLNHLTLQLSITCTFQRK